MVGSRPRLLLTQAALALFSRRMETVEGLLEAASSAVTDADEEHFEPSVGRDTSLLANVPAAIALGRAALAQLRGDAESAIMFGSRALADLGEGEWLLESITRGYLARAELLRGRLAEAEHALSSAIGRWRAGGASTYVAWGCHHLGQVQQAQGRLDAAAGTYQQALEIYGPRGRPVPSAAGVGYVGLAEMAYQRNELDTAQRHVAEGIPLCRQFVSTPPLAAGLAVLAWIRQAHGEAAGALEAISEAGLASPGPDVPGLLNPVPAQRARLLLAQGDVAGAARWTQERGLGVGDEPDYPWEPEYLVLARVLLAQDRPGPAFALLGRLHAAATAQGRTGSVLEIQALQAMGLARRGDENAAVDCLAGALMLGCPRGHVRVFADEGAPMAALVTRLVAAQKAGHAAARGIPLGCLARLLRAFGEKPAAPGAGQAAGAAVPGLVEQLTARELEILVLLAAGMANPRIAEQLVVSLDTVKSTSATSSASSARPTASRPSPGHASSA